MKENFAGKIIDSHAHIFPEKIAKKAVDAIGKYYDIKMTGKGTAADLVLEGEKIRARKYIVHSTATIPGQVKAINDFIAQTCAKYSSFVGFGTLHPGFKDHDVEMDRILAFGMKGIKLHPEFQNYSIDDDSMMPLYTAVAGRLPVLIHTGDEKKDSSSPARLVKILDRFPDLVVIAAHPEDITVPGDGHDGAVGCPCASPRRKAGQRHWFVRRRPGARQDLCELFQEFHKYN